MQPVETTLAHTKASMAPAAPMAWPVIDFVLLTARRSACSPKTSRMAIVSYRSFRGVERAVGVDVVDRLRSDAGARERRAHGALVALAALGRRRHVERIGRRAVADDLGNRLRTAGASVLELLEDEHGSPLGHDEAIARGVERP